MGGNATFTCSATLAAGGGALAWDWLIGGASQGVNAASLTRTPVTAAMNGNQHVCEAIATNVGAGSYVHYFSHPATLTVTGITPTTTTAVPTLGQWALALLALAMLGMAGLHARRQV
ncbi:MAG: IPTL-CTERM sorting domain-containing protein [Proteobacteria bacterium]|nr:IPTL-CTERM sorting domain-containing protein [Pseudomonadota bacterium]